MPPTKSAKRSGTEAPARTATTARLPARGGRKRTRDTAAESDPVAENTEEVDILAASTRTTGPHSSATATASTPAEGANGAQHTQLVSSPVGTPAGRSSAHDQVSAVLSSMEDEEVEESNEGNSAEGLVRSPRSLVTAPVERDDDAGEGEDNVHDSAALAKMRRDVAAAAEKLRSQVEKSIAVYAKAESDLDKLAVARKAVEPQVDEIVQSRHPELYSEVVSLNVGGEVFTVPIATLISKDTPNYFHVLLGVDEAGQRTPVFKDAQKMIFIDRDPATFKHILSYLRGYTYFNMLRDDTARWLKVDATYFQLEGLQQMMGEFVPEVQLQFNAGPGVNLERNRLRVVYGVAVVGDVYLVTGRHSITFEVKIADYIGFGLVSEACMNTDQEFHKIPDCCVYYMSGVFYTNYPYHRKEENLERIENGDFVTMKVDLDKGYVEYVLKNSRKMISIGRARRLRFATTMKLASRVRIVPPEEVQRRLPPTHYTFDE